MLARFFIDRPIFAWVIAIVIMLAGALSITILPVAQYPDVAPPTVTISASYPGASAQTVENSVTQLLEEELTGIDGLLYFSSTSDATGNASIQITFQEGTTLTRRRCRFRTRFNARTPACLPKVNNRA